MGVIFSDFFITESFRKFTEGERAHDPASLPALIDFWQDAETSDKNYKQANAALRDDAKIAQFIEYSRKKRHDEGVAIRKEIYTTAYDDIETSVRAEIKKSLVLKITNNVRNKLVRQVVKTVLEAGLSEIKDIVRQTNDNCEQMLGDIKKQRDEAKNENRELHNKLDASKNIQTLSDLNFELFQTKTANANLRSLAIASIPISMVIYFNDPSMLWMVAAGETCYLGSLGVYKGTLYNRGRTIYEEISRHVSVHPELGRKYDATRPAETPSIGLFNRLRHLRR